MATPREQSQQPEPIDRRRLVISTASSLLVKVNKFFEPLVRIQTDRGHKVIDSGPYAIVRHPGYLFGYPLFLGMPLALGSLWALIPAILLGPLLVLRTIWEDRTLREELPGYDEYAQRVRYRLILGSWRHCPRG